ncbi:RING finger protein B-like, partial [Trifolium medium]|nr:RING finger protein B-like [Trifolium medium]
MLLKLTDVTLFLALQTWECSIIRGEGKEAREGHNAAVVIQRLFIFGGCGKSANNNNEV